MTKEELEEQGFIFETLPSGRINLKNKKQFKINGITATSVGRGEWLRTIEVKSVNEAVNYVKTADFV